MITATPAPSVKWQPIRAKILHRACTTIAERVAEGSNVRHEARRMARKLHGRVLTRNPRKLLDASASTLNRIFYEWIKAGRTMESFLLGYRNATPHRVTVEMAKRWLEIYLAPGTPSKESAYRQVKRELRIPKRRFPSFGTFCRIGGAAFQAQAAKAKRSRQHRQQLTVDEDEHVQKLAFSLAELFQKLPLEQRSKMPQGDLRGVNIPAPGGRSICNAVSRSCSAVLKATPTQKSASV